MGALEENPKRIHTHFNQQQLASFIPVMGSNK
jgi:hypothetical protein